MPVILSKGGRARLDLAMPVETTTSSPDNAEAPADADYVTDAAIRQMEKANMIAALRHANWQIWGDGGAAEILGLKPSTLTYRMKVFGIRKDE